MLTNMRKTMTSNVATQVVQIRQSILSRKTTHPRRKTKLGIARPRAVPVVASALLAATVSVNFSYGDDTEIFFGKEGVGSSSNPNILFVLDTSGSMGGRDGMDQTRMERMQAAMNLLLDQSSSFNVGLMGFNGSGGGGSIRYPVGYLEEDAASDCPDTGCPDQRVVGRGSLAADDAFENPDSGEVIVVGNGTPMGVTTEILQLGAGNPDPGNSGNVVTPGNSGASNQETRIQVATSSVAETVRISDGEVLHKLDESSDYWFNWTNSPELYDKSTLAYRFDNVDLPPNATVLSATLSFTTESTGDQKGVVGAYIRAEANTNPAPYPDPNAVVPAVDPEAVPGAVPLVAPIATLTHLDSRSKTNELIAWPDIPAEPGGVAIESPDIGSLLQEVISLPGWAVGNSISFHIESFDEVEATHKTQRRIHGIGAAAAQRPKLEFTYVVDGDIDSGVSEIIASAHSLEHQNTTTLEFAQEGTLPEADLFFLDINHESGQLALRFDQLGIPAGASVTSAKLTVHTVLPQAANPVDVPEAWAMGINMELSEDPAPYADATIDERDKTINFVDWENIPEDAGVALESPDIASVLQELVDLENWSETSSASIILNPGANDLHTVRRAIETSLGTNKPVLQVSWTKDNTTEEEVEKSLLTGIRFNYLHVPPGALVTSAVIKFHSHSAQAEESSFTIAAENVANSAAFNATDYDLSSRPLTVARETWDVEGWDQVNQPYESVDVTRLVQEIVDRADWCGGNAISMLIDGTGFRDFVSQEENATKSPRLEVFYDPDTVPTEAYCSNKFRVASILSSEDDAAEIESGNVTIADSSLDLADGNVNTHVGVRFRQLGIESGTEIKGANLEFTTAGVLNGGDQLRISIEDSADAPAYSTANTDISGRDYLDITADWGPLPETGADEPVFSVDVTELLQAVVDKGGWTTNSSLAFRIQPITAGTSVPVYASDGSEALGPRLLVYYEGLDVAVGALARDALKATVNSFTASGGTPIVSSLYEAAIYLRGEPVDYGKKRRYSSSNDRYYRVSHPESYTGGTVFRSNECTDQNLDSPDCGTERINGSPVYESPISNRCQQTHLVVLSDGDATANSARDRIKALTGDPSCNTEDYPYAEQCGVELATWLASNDQSSDVPGMQNVFTHTVAFNLSTPKFLEDLAAAGEGDFYSANSSTELLNAFKSIFVNVSKSDTSFVAPSVAVDQFNRLKHRDEMFFAQFKPESTAKWEGNLKKYKVKGNEGSVLTIEDKFEVEAVDESTGQFVPGTTSFWSNVQDGGDVGKGGAASKLSIQTRNIYTYLGTNADLSDPVNHISTMNGELKASHFNLPPEKAEDVDYLASLINWTAGKDPLDENANGDVDEYRQHMGDPMHSQPLVLDYADGDGSKSLVMIGTNEGYLHAVDTEFGIEQYAFIPPELLGNMRKFYENDPQSRRIYGVDGSISAWVDDTNKNGLIDSNETALLYVGMRRGGYNYYVLDISNYDKPKLHYVIYGGVQTSDVDPLTADGDYRELGQTWSRIHKAKIVDGADPRDVIIFGGGYDTNQDPGDTDTEDPLQPDEFGADASYRDDVTGRAIFIADANTGKLLWKPDLDDSSYSDLRYSIPSDLRVVDINSDQLIDQIYFGDMGGQVWRIDFNNSTDAGIIFNNRITGGRIAQLGGDGPEEARRFYYPPDVALISAFGNQQLAVSIGSGWRAHPLQTKVQDRFYSFRLPDVYSAPVDSFGQIRYQTVKEDVSQLTDVTDNLGQDLSDKQGWYINLEGNGEKVLASSLTIDNQVIFTTYTPSNNTEVCAAAVGTGSVYAVDILNGDPVVNFNDGSSGGESGTQLIKSNRKTTLNNPGIATSPTVVFPSGGSATVLVGPESLDEFPIDNFKRRTFWQEHLDENG